MLIDKAVLPSTNWVSERSVQAEEIMGGGYGDIGS